jgi:hypothetical protein
LASITGCNSSTPEAATPPPAPAAPTFFLGDEFTAIQSSTQAVADAGTIWLLDANGDFVFGTDGSANWNAKSGLALTWAQVAGATKYRVLARNTATSPTAWKELALVTAPDPSLNPKVVATGVNPWTAGLGTGGEPWSFGNHVQFAISSENDKGVLPTNGVSDPLDTGDAFPGLLAGIAIDPSGLPVPFDSQVERGATFTKTIRLAFSESMRTSTPPTLTSQGANVTLRRVLASTWGTDPALPLSAPPSAATQAFLKVELAVKGACTENLIDRSPGDFILVVRDATLFSTGASRWVLLLDGATGALLGDATSVTATDAATGQVILGSDLAVAVPAGSLACAATGGSFTAPLLASESGSRVTVSDATPFFVGEPVAITQPAAGQSSALHDVRTVTGVDSVANVLVLSAPLSQGHGTGSIVLPLDGLGGEVALRPSVSMALQRDAIGGPDRELFVAAPANLMVGDMVLVDGDGHLGTTTDQAQARVKQVRFAPTGTALCSVVVDLPPSLTLLHGRAIVVGLGDGFLVGATRDTTSASTAPLDPHADQFSPDGLRY